MCFTAILVYKSQVLELLYKSINSSTVSNEIFLGVVEFTNCTPIMIPGIDLRIEYGAIAQSYKINLCAQAPQI